jgi:hypothetical protein
MNDRCEIETQKHGVAGRRQMALAAMLLAAALPACAASEEEATDQHTTLAGSERAAELGVATWEVRTDGASVRVVGRDTASSRKVEMIVQQDANTPDERVRIEIVFPEHGVFELSNTGELEGASSEYLKDLGAALYSDIGHNSRTVVGVPEDGLGIATSELSMPYSGKIDMPWSMFGSWGVFPFGAPCSPGVQDHLFSYLQYNTAYQCSMEWTSQLPTACNVQVRWGISGWRFDTCFWQIYTRP